MSPVRPIVVIGAGPVGLAAAAHLLDRGLTPWVLEAGDSAGAGMLRWAHVRMFSPWEFTIDRVAGALLRANGWEAPDPGAYPTGGEVVERYLRPLAALSQIAPHLRLGCRVQQVTKRRHDRMKDGNRNAEPFLVRYQDAAGEHEVLAQGVIDASGTIESPSPMGASGVPAVGECAAAANISYGLPDVLGRQRERYAGRRVLVVGSGHSAFNNLQDLARLAAQAPATRIQWALRQPSLQRALGGGETDQLAERGRLGLKIASLIEAGVLQVAPGFFVERVERRPEGLVVADGARELEPVDEIVVATGFRPDGSLLSELRTSLDPGTQAPAALAPLIDPNLHRCGSVRPHGAEELKHPDDGVYIVGMKSYGRAPTFLLVTGYEQARSIAAAMAGDWEAARRVELELPQSGVCITHFEADAIAAGSPSCCGGQDGVHARSPLSAPARADSHGNRAASAPAASEATGCCGGPAPADADACCVRDAAAKAQGEAGCGCSSVPAAMAPAEQVSPSAAAACIDRG